MRHLYYKARVVNDPVTQKMTTYYKKHWWNRWVVDRSFPYSTNASGGNYPVRDVAADMAYSRMMALVSAWVMYEETAK